jgi:predicted DNA-binding protein YlxM (UPF0122 family)
MEDIFEITMLLDFYGQMLTQKQQNIINMYYCDDYSLAEIAENLLISRQGVYDNIKRTRQTLKEYEDKLGLVKRFLFIKEQSQNIIELLKSVDISKMDEKDSNTIGNINTKLNELLTY